MLRIVDGAVGNDVVGFSCRHDTLPQRVSVLAILQVQLIAKLSTPAGSRNDHRDAV